MKTLAGLAALQLMWVGYLKFKHQKQIQLQHILNSDREGSLALELQYS